MLWGGNWPWGQGYKILSSVDRLIITSQTRPEKERENKKIWVFRCRVVNKKLFQTFAGYSSTQASSTSREKHEKQFKTSWDRFCWDENANPPLSFFFFSTLAYSQCRGTKGLLSVRLPSRCRLRAFPISKKILTTQTCYYSRRNARRARDYFWPSSRSNWREISFLHSDLPLRLRFRHRFQKLTSRSSVSDSRPMDRVKGKRGLPLWAGISRPCVHNIFTAFTKFYFKWA